MKKLHKKILVMTMAIGLTACADLDLVPRCHGNRNGLE